MNYTGDDDPPMSLMMRRGMFTRTLMITKIKTRIRKKIRMTVKKRVGSRNSKTATVSERKTTSSSIAAKVRLEAEEKAKVASIHCPSLETFDYFVRRTKQLIPNFHCSASSR